MLKNSGITPGPEGGGEILSLHGESAARIPYWWGAAEVISCLEKMGGTKFTSWAEPRLGGCRPK
jgi:hypothetical protein